MSIDAVVYCITNLRIVTQGLEFYISQVTDQNNIHNPERETSNLNPAMFQIVFSPIKRR